jgi:hypothetical protein
MMKIKIAKSDIKGSALVIHSGFESGDIPQRKKARGRINGYAVIKHLFKRQLGS